MQERLDVRLMIPGKNLPAYERHIIAQVNFEGESKTYKFGRNQSIAHIWRQIPRLVMDDRFDQKIKGRGVVLSLDAVRNRRAMTA